MTQTVWSDLSFLGKLAFSGPDRRKFLNGLLTNDVLSLKEGSGQAECLLTPKGKLVAYFHLYDLGDELLAVGPPAVASVLLRSIEKNLMLSETKAADKSRDFAAFCLAGPGAQARGKGLGLRVFPYEVHGPGGVLALAPAPRAAELRSSLESQGPEASLEAMETSRVEAGVPAFGLDWDDDAFPAELGLEAAISYTKGCYLGQEITARIKNLGEVRRRLVGLKAPPRARSADPVLYQGTPVGRLGSVADSPRLGARLALALIRADLSAPGTPLEVDGRPAVVCGLPFLR